MYNIDKEKFAAFVYALRKEKGITQKELAEALYVSDKAVSKWENARSIPDVTLLIPLAENLGVTVTELLQGERNKESAPIPPQQVEDIVKTAVNISVENDTNKTAKRRMAVIYVICLVTGLWTLYRMKWHISVKSTVMLMPLMLVIASALFGLYFLFLAPQTLPDYYDNNKINYYVNGAVRIHIPGVYFTNRNWKHILKWLRLWCLTTLSTCSVFTIAIGYLIAELFVAFRPAFPHPMYRFSTWETAVLVAVMAVYLGGLFATIYIPGKKYK